MPRLLLHDRRIGPAQQLHLDFVQKEIRYFGTEIGSNSHRPATPRTVIEQRFGDCKDKTALLIALLKELNIQAAPVLVSTHYRSALQTMLPSPLAFNHVITRIELEGKTYWLDGTRSHQTGPVAERQSVGMGSGLILRSNSGSLVEMPGTRTEERIAAQDTFRIVKFSQDPVLESRLTYPGETAEYVRDAIASQAPCQIETQMATEYARYYQIRINAPLRIEEVPEHNGVGILQQFTVPGFWDFPEQRMLYGEVGFWNPVQALRYPNTSSRQRPFRIQSPGIYRHTVTFDFPDDISRTSDSKRNDERSPYLEYHVKCDSTPRRTQMRGELHLLTDVITAKEWPTYIQKIEKMKPLLVGYVSVPAITLTQWDALKEELRLLDELARKGKKASKLATPTQTRAEAKQITLTAQLESGRLEPAMRAEALRARGVQLDILGKETLAAADFDEALKLLPDNASIQSSAAVNAFVRGQYPDALAHAEQALQLNPSDTSPHRVHADALYVSGDYAGAKSDLLALLDSRAEIENSYAALKLYLTARQLGKDRIDAVKSYLPTDPNPAWPYPVLQFFISAADYGQAQAAAKEEASDPSRLCELYYYVGEKYLLEGNRRLAREYFQKSIDTGVIEFTEYVLSRPAAGRNGHTLN